MPPCIEAGGRQDSDRSAAALARTIKERIEADGPRLLELDRHPTPPGPVQDRPWARRLTVRWCPDDAIDGSLYFVQ